MSQHLTPDEAARQMARSAAEKYLRDACDRIRNARKGERPSRHDLLASAAGGCANRIAAGLLSQSVVEQELRGAALASGLDGGEVERAIRDLLVRGDASRLQVHNGGGTRRTIVNSAGQVPFGGRTLQLVTDTAPSGGANTTARPVGKVAVPMTPGTRVKIDTTLPTVPLLHHDVRVTYFRNTKTTQGNAQIETWDTLAVLAQEPEEWTTDVKRSLGLWSWSEFEDDNRSKRGGEVDADGKEAQRPCEIHGIHALVLDYDDETTFSMERVHEWWGDVQYVAHTTASHLIEKRNAGAHGRGRVIIALSRVVSEAEFAEVASWVLQSGRGVIGRKEIVDTHRVFFIPVRAPQGYECRHNLNGAALDVDAVLGRWREYAVQRKMEMPLIVKVPSSSVWFIRSAGGGFHSCDAALVRLELQRHWPDVPTYTESDFGPKPIGTPGLYGMYGMRGDRVFYTYGGRSRFVQKAEHDGDLYISIPIDDPPPPVLHEDVLDWLRTLTGSQFDRTLDWLATVGLLASPTAAIVLLGVPSLGKGMFASGVARYFGAALTDYDDVFKERFNDALLRSPVVFLDEGTKSKGGSAQFRKMLGNRIHAIEAKGQPTATLLGCPRLIVAANNPDPLGLSREELTKADEDAIGKRLVLVDCQEDAREWLVMRGGAAYTQDWVARSDGSPGKFPELISWLAANRTVEQGERFLVEGDSGEWALRIGTREGLPSTVLYAIGRYIESDDVRSVVNKKPDTQPIFFDADRSHLVFVSNEGLREFWQVLTGEARAPSHRGLQSALTRLAPGGRERVTVTPANVKNASRRWLYGVAVELLDVHEDDWVAFTRS